MEHTRIRINFLIFFIINRHNPTLSSIQKREYLRSAVQGKATRVIEVLETTESNYEDAL